MLALGLAAVPTAHAAPLASSPGPLLWTAPVGIDTQPIDSMACPSTVLCVAVDRAGQVLWSTDPAGGPRAWAAADVDGATEMTSISCPSTALCVAVDAAGDVITSTDPAGGAAAWTVARFDPSTTRNNTDNAGGVLVRGVSCPSTGLCVAVDAAGNVLVSADPTGGASAWTIVHIDTATSYGCTGVGLACQPPLTAIACPATTLCAAVDFSGNLLTTVSTAAVDEHAHGRGRVELTVRHLVSEPQFLRHGGWGRATRHHSEPIGTDAAGCRARCRTRCTGSGASRVRSASLRWKRTGGSPGCWVRLIPPHRTQPGR